MKNWREIHVSVEIHALPNFWRFHDLHRLVCLLSWCRKICSVSIYGIWYVKQQGLHYWWGGCTNKKIDYGVCIWVLTDKTLNTSLLFPKRLIFFLELISVNTLLGWMEEKYITFKHLSFIILPKISFVSLPITALATVKWKFLPCIFSSLKSLKKNHWVIKQ